MFNRKFIEQKIEETGNVYTKYSYIITIISIVISIIFIVFKLIAYADTFSVFHKEDIEGELLNFGLDSSDSAVLENRKIIPPENTQIPYDFIKYM